MWVLVLGLNKKEMMARSLFNPGIVEKLSR